MRTAIFPGSFDPFTAGHLDVLDSALKLFDKVIVAVGYNSNKTTGFFPVDIRIKIIKDAIKPYGERVDVCCYKQLTIDLCHKLGVNFIVRGLRTTTPRPTGCSTRMWSPFTSRPATNTHSFPPPLSETFSSTTATPLLSCPPELT